MHVSNTFLYCCAIVDGVRFYPQIYNKIWWLKMTAETEHFLVWYPSSLFTGRSSTKKKTVREDLKNAHWSINYRQPPNRRPLSIIHYLLTISLTTKRG